MPLRRLVGEMEVEHDTRCPQCSGHVNQGELLYQIEDEEYPWCESCLIEAVKTKSL